MKLFIVGNFKANTGPASVNKTLRSVCDSNTLFSDADSEGKRILELFSKILKSDAILFSGLSKINLIGLKLAKLFNKKSAYLMHGCYANEVKLNNESDEKRVELEKKVLELSPKIICVSKYFMLWVKDNYPQYKDKVFYVNNSIDLNAFKSTFSDSAPIKRDDNLVMSLGGGAPQKNIKYICMAVDTINKEHNRNLKMFVFGSDGNDLSEITCFPFVKYVPRVPKTSMPEYYAQTRLYIQNSSFDTFGLAPLEALVCGCDILLSKYVGCASAFDNLSSNDVIDDPTNVHELSEKILYVLDNSNNSRLMDDIDKDVLNPSKSLEKIKVIINS